MGRLFRSLGYMTIAALGTTVCSTEAGQLKAEPEPVAKVGVPNFKDEKAQELLKQGFKFITETDSDIVRRCYGTGRCAEKFGKNELRFIPMHDANGEIIPGMGVYGR